MTKVLVSETYLTAIAEAIRGKNGSTTVYKPGEMAAAIAGIEAGGGSGGSRFGLTLDNFIAKPAADGSLSAGDAADVSLPGVTKINFGVFYCSRCIRSLTAPDLASVGNADAMKYAFQSSPELKSVSFPALTDVSASTAFIYAFAGCPKLTTISFPMLAGVSGTYAFQHAFNKATQLTSVSFPKLKTVSGSYAFTYCFSGASAMTSVSFPELVNVTGSNAFDDCFQDCKALVSALFPKLETVGDKGFTYAFSGCTSLTLLEFPALTTLDCNPASSASSGKQFSSSFRARASVTVRFPKLKAIYANGGTAAYGTFYGCDGLARIDLPSLTTIGTHYTGTGSVSDVAIKNLFAGCTNLKEIHFGAANQAAVEALPGYDTLWGRGAGNATVYFDL